MGHALRAVKALRRGRPCGRPVMDQLMRHARHLVGLVCRAAGAIGLLVSLTGIAGCWWLYALATSRVDRVFDRVDVLLADVARETDQVESLLRQVGQDIDARRLLSDRAREVVARRLDEAREKLIEATEIGQKINGMLETTAEMAITERVGVDTTKLAEVSRQLSDLIGRTKKLTAALAVSPAGPIETLAAVEVPGLVKATAAVIALLVDVSGRAHAVRGRLTELRHRTIRAMTVAAAAATALAIWIGLGQFALSVQGRRLFRKPGS
jgi:hypothetical protein